MTDIGLLAAFGGGVVSCLSPCVLPIIPGYLSVVTGLSAEELEAGGARRSARVAVYTGLFVLGFGTVFVLLGAGAGSFARVLFRHQAAITRVAGGLVLVMALYLLGSQVWLRRPGLYREMRFHPRLERFGPFAAPVAGAAFGFGWTPCIGPVLGSILAVAAAKGGAAHGALLLGVYSLGMGVPFLLIGLTSARVSGVVGWFQRHGAALTAASAVVLGAFGVVLMLNRLPWVTARLQDALDALGLGRLVTLG